MITLANDKKIFICVAFADFRMGIDGLAEICKARLKEDPFSGAIFLFMNRRKNSIKILNYDGQGFWLMQKRLSCGTFRWWPSTLEDAYVLDVYQLQVFLRNGNPQTVKVGDNWKKVS